MEETAEYGPQYHVRMPKATMSESIKEIAGALSKAQGCLEGATKDSINPHFKSKFANLESVWHAIRKPLADNGLSVTQLVAFDNNVTLLETVLMHSSGEWISSTMPILARDNSAQAMGSGLSYARRYALAAIVGVYQTDDDGNDAQGTENPFPPQPHQPEGGGGKSFPQPKNYSPVGKEIMPFGKTKGKAFKDISHSELISAIAWAKSVDKFKEFQVEAQDYLNKNPMPGAVDTSEEIPF